jgi:hypothetical protein
MANEEKKAKFLEVKSAGSKLVFAFGNGTRREFDTAAAPQAIREQALIHGFNQKLRDSTAGFSKELDYVGAVGAIDKVIEGLVAGEWNRAGGGTSGQAMQDLADAIAKLKKSTPEKAMAAVEKATPEQRAAWAKNPTIAAHIAEAKAKRAKVAAKDADADLDIEL